VIVPISTIPADNVCQYHACIANCNVEMEKSKYSIACTGTFCSSGVARAMLGFDLLEEA